MPSSLRRTTYASTPGNGRPIEPGLMSNAGVFAIMMPPVSVCHQLSWIGKPSTRFPHQTASALSGSPTLAMNRSRGNRYCAASSGPALISMRIAVGAVYQTVTPWSCRIRYQRSASNSASSTIDVTPCSRGVITP